MAAASSIRGPLLTTTNGSNSPPPSPPTTAGRLAKAGNHPTGPVDPVPDPPALRRKSTVQDLNLDSSESYPSPHSSLYEASVGSVNDTDQNPDDGWGDDTILPDLPDANPPSWLNTICGANGDPLPSSFLQPTPTKRSYVPHKLYSITEQSSFATLQPSFASKSSLKERPSNLTLRSRRSRSPCLNGMKRKSFSLSDLPEPEPVRSPTPSPPATIRLVPTPNQPTHPPPIRSTTPPGLPSFGKPEASTYRLPPPPESPTKKRSSTLKRFRNRSASPEMQQWRRQTASLPKGVVMRSSDGILVSGKFTPTQSGHTGPIRRVTGALGPENTWVDAPVAEIEQRRNRSEHGTTADWTNAVMSGTIGVGPPGPVVRDTVGNVRGVQYSYGGTQAERERIKKEKKERRRKRWQRWWDVFKGRGRSGTTTLVEGDGVESGCCKGMWGCCPGVEEEVGREGNIGVRVVMTGVDG